MAPAEALPQEPTNSTPLPARIYTNEGVAQMLTLPHT